MDKLSSYLVISPPFLQDNEPSSVILFATRTGATYQLPRATWEKLSNNEFSAMPDSMLTELRQAKVLVPYEENELRTILNENRNAIENNKHLNYVIQPTAHCQLGCGYCGQQHSRVQLSEINEQAIVEDVRRRLAAGKFAELNLCWFGAEPLAGMRGMRSLTPLLKRVAEAAGSEYRASIITNGLAMSPSVGAELVDDLHVVSITVSLDGTAAYHDARRHTKMGRATYNRILANLLSLVAAVGERPVEIKVRCNVDRENADGVIPLLHELHERGIHRRIQFYVAPIHGWGNDAHLRSLGPEEFAELEIAWLCEMAMLGFNVSLIPAVQRVVCLAVQPQAALVDAHGGLFNCTEVSYVPAYGDPNTYSLGNVRQGESGSARALLGNFNDEVEAGRYDCGSCRMLPVCGGACPKEWDEGRKPCPSAKRNMPERLLLAMALPRIAAGGTPTDADHLRRRSVAAPLA
ncbi:MAG TPA: radical SAM protein [Steroidobacteraceae bacterium]|jgi:uncharacterized protein|nr:radical SAM protein [Steroidobacteraceae bacterium]